MENYNNFFLYLGVSEVVTLTTFNATSEEHDFVKMRTSLFNFYQIIKVK